MSIILHGTLGAIIQSDTSVTQTGQVIISAPEGTPPLVVESTTMAPNLTVEVTSKLLTTNWIVRQDADNLNFISDGEIKTSISPDGTVTSIGPSNAVWAWGTNWAGQLGINQFGGPTAVSSPTQITPNGSRWSQIASSKYLQAAINANGELWTWGDNSNADLVKATGSDWKSVACGAGHRAAIKTDGTLWTWGSNYGGQLGDNTTTYTLIPIQTISAGTDWKQVSCGYHTVAIKTDGTLWAWGPNHFGQVGDGTTSGYWDGISSPVQTIAGGADWKQVSCGREDTAAIKTDGTLWTWGRHGGSIPSQTISVETGWKSVACGDSHAAAIKTDGTLWLWGRDSYGQLGDNTSFFTSYVDIGTSSPVQTIAGGTNWKQVSCGTMHTAAIKTDGTLWIWGSNSYGQLGDNTTTYKSSPVQTISAGTDWKQVSCGYNHTAAIK